MGVCGPESSDSAQPPASVREGEVGTGARALLPSLGKGRKPVEGPLGREEEVCAALGLGLALR